MTSSAWTISRSPYLAESSACKSVRLRLEMRPFAVSIESSLPGTADKRSIITRFFVSGFLFTLFQCRVMLPPNKNK